MIGMSDLLLIQVLREGFDFLSKNPHHIRFALGDYEGCTLKISEHILKESVSFFQNNAVYIGPYYDIQQNSPLGIAVQSQGSENELFVGDYGFTQELTEFRRPPTVFSSFTATSITEDRMGLIVALSYNLDSKVWIGQFVSHSSLVSKVVGIVKYSTHYLICLGDSIPEGADLRGWKTSSDLGGTIADMGVSGDNVQVDMSLFSYGDPSIHRLLSVLTRYILKQNRLKLIHTGLQKPTLSYSAMQCTDIEQFRYESTVRLSCIVFDYWIASERLITDSSSTRIDLDFIATSPPKADVPLG